jgi:hypothetical protein
MPRYHVTIQQAVIETTKVEIEASDPETAKENAILQLYNIMQDGCLDWEYFDAIGGPMVETVERVRE